MSSREEHPPKACEVCGTSFCRADRTSDRRWAARRFCGKKCACAAIRALRHVAPKAPPVTREPRALKEEPSRAQLRLLYCGREKLSASGIAGRYGLGIKHVDRLLREAEIPRRSAWEQITADIAAGRRVHPSRSQAAREKIGASRRGQPPSAAFVEAARHHTTEHNRRISEGKKRPVLYITKPCLWCGEPVVKPEPIWRQRGDRVYCSPRCWVHLSKHRGDYDAPITPRPLILTRLVERMAELRKQGLPIGAATMQKAAEPIGASGIELEAYLVTLTPRELDEYLDNQLEHDVRAAGL